MSPKIQLSFNLNGRETSLAVKPEATLLQVLRDQLQLTGTKKGCEEGECGACTVLVEGVPVLACLQPALKCQGLSVRTVEGLAQDDRLHPLQEAFIETGAVQCGYCTPGMLMTSKALLDNNPSPDQDQIAGALAGNLCRCTGYVKIFEAISLAASRIRDQKGE